MIPDIKDFYAKLEAAGEQAARDALASGAYGARRQIVEEWLRKKAAEREALVTERVDARAEQRIDLAQQANDIARTSAKTARDAYRISVLSVIAALVALLVAALTFLARY